MVYFICKYCVRNEIPTANDNVSHNILGFYEFNIRLTNELFPVLDTIVQNNDKTRWNV